MSYVQIEHKKDKTQKKAPQMVPSEKEMADWDCIAAIDQSNLSILRGLSWNN
jgi:hypothetical protein